MRVHLAGNHSRFDEPDIGLDRSSSGWIRLPNFITSSALIRVLGAMEQFEIDVLKALLYYRPHGKTNRSASLTKMPNCRLQQKNQIATDTTPSLHYGLG